MLVKGYIPTFELNSAELGERLQRHWESPEHKKERLKQDKQILDAMTQCASVMNQTNTSPTFMQRAIKATAQEALLMLTDREPRLLLKDRSPTLHELYLRVRDSIAASGTRLVFADYVGMPTMRIDQEFQSRGRFGRNLFHLLGDRPIFGRGSEIGTDYAWGSNHFDYRPPPADGSCWAGKQAMTLKFDDDLTREEKITRAKARMKQAKAYRPMFEAEVVEGEFVQPSPAAVDAIRHRGWDLGRSHVGTVVSIRSMPVPPEQMRVTFDTEATVDWAAVRERHGLEPREVRPSDHTMAWLSQGEETCCWCGRDVLNDRCQHIPRGAGVETRIRAIKNRSGVPTP